MIGTITRIHIKLIAAKAIVIIIVVKKSICFHTSAINRTSTVRKSFENLLRITPDGVTSKNKFIGANKRYFSILLNSLTPIVRVNTIHMSGANPTNIISIIFYR